METKTCRNATEILSPHRGRMIVGGFQAHATLGAARTAIKAAGGVPVYDSNAVTLNEVTR